MRSFALTTPTDRFTRSAAYVRPSATAQSPTRKDSIGAGTAGVRSSASTRSSVSRRASSSPSRSAARRRPSGRRTRIEVGFPAKVSLLVRISPSARTTVPVAGPAPSRRPSAVSTPPSTSIRTTLGATAAAAALNAASSWATTLPP